ncbi:hypothetical protein Vadar_015529 [Vaccinium darrowii]|uniref:Uncharacterized protein n=1 Tax=Vaccinium darrowii TaxID=229202 RepID=A0ACB7XHP7_9ERIC|nr:hypothetical protein Vadar_015529 [Vaccinium darrowii]
MDAVVDWEEEIEDGQERKVDTTLFPQLSKLQLDGLSNLTWLCRGPVPGGSFGELTSVEIRGCDNLRYAFNSSMARHLVHLKELNISDCSEMDAVVDWAAEIEDGQERKVDTTLFPQLSKLQLDDLSNLTRLCRGPVPGGSFGELTSIEIRGCDNLRYAFNSSMARHLVHLKELNISNCSRMFAVVDWAAEIEDGQERKVDTTLFPQLSKLQLDGLSNLTWLCRGPVPGGSFGELTSVEIRGCDNLRYAFNSSMARHLVHLKELNISDCSEMFAVVDWAAEIEDGQERKVDTTLFPQLSKLQLDGLSNLTWLCRGPVPGGSFGELTFVEIRGCDNLRYAFNSSMARHLVHLKELNISDCSRMFAVVDWAEEIEDGQERKVTFPCLEDLILHQLHNWGDKYFSELLISSFPTVKKLEVSFFRGSGYVFHSSLAGHLVHLKELNISNCWDVEAVFGREEEIEDGQERKVDTTLFPQLRKLQLNNLLNLKRFCHFTHTLELPMLSELDIRGCHSMEEFSLGHVSTPNLSSPGISWNRVLNPDISWNGDLNNAIRLLQKVSKKREQVERAVWLSKNFWSGSDMWPVGKGTYKEATNQREKEEREKVERERFAGVEEDLQRRCRVAIEDIHGHSLDSDEKREKEERKRFAGVEEELQGRRRVANDDIQEHSLDSLQQHSLDSDETREKAERDSFAGVKEELQGRRRVADDDIHEHSLDSDEKREKAEREGFADVEELQGRCKVTGGDIHERSLDLDEMNSTISWRETLPPNPQRGRCICFRTADLYTDTSVITRFYSVPFDLFGDGGDDDASSSNPDVEGLEPFYKCTDFATTSTLSFVGSSLFVVGGSKETGPCRVSITTEKMYRFDTAAPENDWYKWVELSMQTPRAFPITVAMDGKLYIFGGSDPESPDAPLAELFDPESSTSVPLPLPSGFPINAWCHLVVAALQPSKKILVASGLSSDAYEYSVVDQGWEKLDYEVDFSSVQGQAAVVQNGNALCWCSNNVDEVHAYHLVHKWWFKSPIKGLDKVGMRDPDGLAHYCPIFSLDDNHLCLLWKDHMGYDGTNLPLLHCVKIQVSIDLERSRFDAVVVASRTYALGPDESIFDAHVFLREDDEGGERGSGWGGHENGGRTWERSGYGGGKRTVSSIAPFKTCSKCWGTGHTESSCNQVGSGAEPFASIKNDFLDFEELVTRVERLIYEVRGVKPAYSSTKFHQLCRLLDEDYYYRTVGALRRFGFYMRNNPLFWDEAAKYLFFKKVLTIREFGVRAFWTNVKLGDIQGWAGDVQKPHLVDVRDFDQNRNHPTYRHPDGSIVFYRNCLGHIREQKVADRYHDAKILLALEDDLPKVWKNQEGMLKGIHGGKHGKKFFTKMNGGFDFINFVSTFNLARIERSAQKQAKSSAENAGWYEKWWEKYDAKGWTEKGARKYGRLDEQSWWEK